MESSNDTHFGGQTVTISVGRGKTKFSAHKDALTSIASNFICSLSNPEAPELDTADLVQAELPEERAETFREFLNWLYAAYVGVTFFCLPSATASLFQLYAFAYKYAINCLEDAIVSTLYKKFAHDHDHLWLTLGSDKLALETFLKVVSSGTHLYRLVIRSLAYSMRLRAEDPWFHPGRELYYSTFPRTPSTEHQVEDVMSSVPSELWGPIAKEILLVKTLGGWRQDFVSVVGFDTKFLRRGENIGAASPSTNSW